ncbi:MAG TPA: radical SAM protein [Archangium sp.]|nr:radical SAM protein [Archangium sp.]
MSDVDLLLLNCSNLPWRPIFPYAFVQVSAVARRYGLSVKRVDMLDVRKELWEPMLRSLIETHRPRMIGLHLRQGDSLVLGDYNKNERHGTPSRDFFPVEDSQLLIQKLRRLTRVPIVLGGFGFTTHARRLFERLEVDLGVQGCPDEFFARFEDVLAGRQLESVGNLIYRNERGYQANARIYANPSEEREYTDELVGEMSRFYGHAQLYGSNPPTIAVEVARGCPYRCYFCTEPHVKGRRISYRNLDVVMEEVDFLLRHNLTRLWFVTSEMNIGGSDFALTLAERILKLNEKRPHSPIEWSGYSLPMISEADLRVLFRSGYVGALNDVMSLDDDNLKRTRVPYRSQHAVSFLKAMQKLAEEETATTQGQPLFTPDEKLRAQLATRTPKELGSFVSLFLGNAHSDEATLRNTLRRIEEEGLREKYKTGHVIASTRVFELGDGLISGKDGTLVSFDRKGERPVDVTWPTFHYPKFLMDRLGSPEAILDFFAYVGSTFMSVAHRTRKDWCWFISNKTSVETFHGWWTEALRALPDVDTRSIAHSPPAVALLEQLRLDPSKPRLRNLFSPAAADKPAAQLAVPCALEHLFTRHREQVRPVLELLGVPHDERGHSTLSEYRLAELLYRRYASTEQLLGEVAATLPVASESLEMLYTEWLLYANNILLRPEYKDLLFDQLPPGPQQPLAVERNT